VIGMPGAARGPFARPGPDEGAMCVVSSGNTWMRAPRFLPIHVSTDARKSRMEPTRWDRRVSRAEGMESLGESRGFSLPRGVRWDLPNEYLPAAFSAAWWPKVVRFLMWRWVERA
jgi:hypothetical protein